MALALVAQDRVPLARIARTYGSGVYAIYYHGDHPAYAAVSGTETPIYVGKADPKSADART
ncbi:MAG: Eco29kI family restriction endonuclease, partial [Xanthomonas perforans]|nr:Eco29kI family restriction endonuclease [Xanthomonas perforans]